MPLGLWNKSVPIMDINYYEETKILEFHTQSSIKTSAHRSWVLITARTRAQAQDTYHRAMSMDNRIRYICVYLLQKILYLTQIFLPLDAIMRQLNMTILWFLWHAEIFRVPLSTLRKLKEHGGYGLINPTAKCLALFITHTQELGMRKGTVTADWMRRCGLQEQTKNPLHNKRTPTALEYLNRYNTETAYLSPRGNLENSKTYKRHLYTVILTSLQAVFGHQQLCVERKRPHIE
jgi:hypothetical protein